MLIAIGGDVMGYLHMPVFDMPVLIPLMAGVYLLVIYFLLTLAERWPSKGLD